MYWDPVWIGTQQLFNIAPIANTPFSLKTRMVRAKKAIAPPARPKSTRTSVKISKKKAFDAAAVIKRARATRPPARQKAPAPVEITPAPPSPRSLASRDSPPLVADIDVSKTQYELNISCSLDQTQIITRVRHMVLGEFKLHPFLSITIKTIAQRAGKSEGTVSWDEGMAELRHRGLKRVSDYSEYDVSDLGDWEWVEKVLKAWMTENLLDIRVDFTLNFKTVEDEIQQAENAASSSDIEDIATPAPQGNRGVRLLESVAKNSAKQSPESM